MLYTCTVLCATRCASYESIHIFCRRLWFEQVFILPFVTKRMQGIWVLSFVQLVCRPDFRHSAFFSVFQRYPKNLHTCRFRTAGNHSFAICFVVAVAVFSRSRLHAESLVFIPHRFFEGISVFVYCSISFQPQFIRWLADSDASNVQ